MKKIISLLLSLGILCCMFTGCGLNSTMPVDSIIKKVALITDYLSVDDQGYNQFCWEGVEAWCSPIGIDYAYYQPIEDSDDGRIVAIDRAIADGSNVIVLPGYLFGITLIEIQEKYPDVYFIAVDLGQGDMTRDYVTYCEPTANTVCMTFAEEQAGYLAGYATVKEGYTKLGFLGGAAIPPIIRYGYGFVQGADAAATEMGVDIFIKYTYEGLFYCGGYPDRLSRLQHWEEQGIEVIFPCSDTAPRYAQDLNAQIIAPDTDMSHVSPNILTSAKKELRTAVEYALTGLYEGRWESELGGQFINLTLQDGDIVGLPTTEEAFRFQNFTIEEYEAVKADIRTGVISVSDSFEFMPTVSEHTVIEEIG